MRDAWGVMNEGSSSINPPIEDVSGAASGPSIMSDSIMPESPPCRLGAVVHHHTGAGPGYATRGKGARERSCRPLDGEDLGAGIEPRTGAVKNHGSRGTGKIRRVTRRADALDQLDQPLR